MDPKNAIEIIAGLVAEHIQLLQRQGHGVTAQLAQPSVEAALRAIKTAIDDGQQAREALEELERARQFEQDDGGINKKGKAENADAAA